MKRMLLMTVLSMFMISQAVSVNKTAAYQVILDIADFDIEKDSVGRVTISSDEFPIGFNYDINFPGLPSKPIAVALPVDTRFVSCSFVATSKKLIHNNIYVMPNPKVVVIGETNETESLSMPDYGATLYPDVALTHSYDVYTDKATISYFSFCPFEYEAAGGNLSFIQRGELIITYADGHGEKCIKTRVDESDERRFAETVIGYPLEPYEISVHSLTGDNVNIGQLPEPEYLIITNKSLKNQFQELADWKTIRGVPTEVVTVEEIVDSSSMSDIPLCLKKYIRTCYQKFNKLQYVLLGGDDTVIPVRYCYGANGAYSTNALVTDLYYACLSGEYEWDANGNGIYGEPSDSIDLSIQLNISRLPVRTPAHVKAYVDKLIKYEGPKKQSDFINNPVETNRFLISGVKLLPNERICNVYTMYRNLSSLVDSLWSGDIVCFMDKMTDIEGGANYDLSATDLQYQLSSGYRFMSMFSHGQQTCWEIENKDIYTSDLAASLNSNSNSLITTIACHTNAFDSTPIYHGVAFNQDPCLSEAFIRNPYNSVIAYLGASREGLGADAGLGPSFNYNREFYKSLFSNICPYNNFSRVVAATKLILTNALYNKGDIVEANCWVHFCLNPVGDAEVPIFTDIPLEQEEPAFSMPSKNVLAVTVDNDECRIAISGASDAGKSYYGVTHKGSALFNGFDGRTVYITISRPGYRPLLYYGMQIKGDYKFIRCDSYPYNIVKLPPIGEIKSCVVAGDRAYVTTKIEGKHDNIEILSLSSDGTLLDSVKIDSENENETNNLLVRTGVNMVSLIVNGETLDSKIIVK